MRDVLSNLERHWTDFAASGVGRRVLDRWQQEEPILVGYASLHDLSQAARDQDGRDLDHRDSLHLALLRLAEHDEDARLTMLHLLLPALIRTARLYSDTWSYEEAASLAVFAATDRIVRYPHGLPRPAASIVRWVRRAVGKEAARQRRLPVVVQLDDVEQPAPDDQPACAELIDLVVRARRAGAIDHNKARLVVLNRVAGVSTADIAERAGFPKSTIRKRRNRAEAAIAAYAAKEAA